MGKLSNKGFPIPPSLKKNSQSLTNNTKPYHSNLVHGASRQTNKTDNYQTIPSYSDQKGKKPRPRAIDVLIEKDQDEYQIDVNTPQFQRLMGLKMGSFGSPSISRQLPQSKNSSQRSNPKILQYQNSGITFKDSFIPRGDSLMSQNSKDSFNTFSQSNTEPEEVRPFAEAPGKDARVTVFDQFRSPAFKPDFSGSGQSPEINAEKLLTPESRSGRVQNFSKKREQEHVINSQEFLIENKQIEEKGSNFSYNQESELDSGADISLECTTENLNFGLHWSPGIEQRAPPMPNYNLSGVSGRLRNGRELPQEVHGDRAQRGIGDFAEHEQLRNGLSRELLHILRKPDSHQTERR